MTIKTGVVGAAGFAGIEAARRILSHPEFELSVATSTELAGQSLASVYPSLAGVTDLCFTVPDESTLSACDLIFLAVPHTAAMAYAPALIEAGKTVIDLSADFRLKDPIVYEQWYGVPHTATDLLSRAAFGLPELFRNDLQQAAKRHLEGEGVLVGCAGCYPTATSLAAAPAIRAGLLGDGIVVVDAISGVSGAGKKANQRTHFCFADENLEAYGVASHRHTPEIEQILGIEERLVFTPHLAPLNRGLLSTVTMPLAKGISEEELNNLYNDFYKDSPFVTVLKEGCQPRTASVAGTNRAHIAAVVNAKLSVIIATCAIDNVGKGAAGQAIQCANIVYGFSETCGLEATAVPA